MLDILDFIQDKGGDPKKVKESQRRRYAPEGVVEETQSLYEDARTSPFPTQSWTSKPTLRVFQRNTPPHRPNKR